LPDSQTLLIDPYAIIPGWPTPALSHLPIAHTERVRALANREISLKIPESSPMALAGQRIR